MATVVNTPLVSLEEYLNTSYEPDCDYVDGALEDRNVGQSKHSAAQGELLFWLRTRALEHGRHVRPEQRVRVSPSRVRVPDVCLVDPADRNEVVQSTPRYGSRSYLQTTGGSAFTKSSMTWSDWAR